MKTKDVIEYFGSAANAARALGIKRQAVAKWGDLVPEARAYHVQVVTNGALKVDPAVYGSRDAA